MKKKCPRCGIKQDGLVECEICGLFLNRQGNRVTKLVGPYDPRDYIDAIDRVVAR
jgi:transcription elongation factor Elf1